MTDPCQSRVPAEVAFPGTRRSFRREDIGTNTDLVFDFTVGSAQVLQDELAFDEDGDDRNVIVVFHNFKGYDGMFVLPYLYRTHREVKDQITIGTKILSLKSDNLTFKDSLLSSFSSRHLSCRLRTDRVT